MYIISELTGKIYLNDVEIPLDDSTAEFHQYLIDKDIIGVTYVSATESELEQLNRPKVPEIVSRRQFKIALAVLGYNENDILNGIEQLPEPNKTIARISYTESGTFERYSSDLIYVSKTFLGLTDEEIDEVFLTAINY